MRAARRESLRCSAGRNTSDIGFNPFHQHKTSRADYAMMAAALVIVVTLVLWGFFGGKL